MGSDPRLGSGVGNCSGNILRLDQPRAEPVLVDAPGLGDPALEDLERRGQEPGQPQQPLGAAIDLRARLEARGHQPLERRDGLVAPPELVVEGQDLDDEPGTQAERRGSSVFAPHRARPS